MPFGSDHLYYRMMTKNLSWNQGSVHFPYSDNDNDNELS